MIVRHVYRRYGGPAFARFVAELDRDILADGEADAGTGSTAPRPSICGRCDGPDPRAGSRRMTAERDRRFGGIGLGGLIVIIGVILMFVWSFWIGLIIALVGLIAFGGFVRGKWY